MWLNISNTCTPVYLNICSVLMIVEKGRGEEMLFA